MKIRNEIAVRSLAVKEDDEIGIDADLSGFALLGARLQ